MKFILSLCAAIIAATIYTGVVLKHSHPSAEPISPFERVHRDSSAVLVVSVLAFVAAAALQAFLKPRPKLFKPTDKVEERPSHWKFVTITATGKEEQVCTIWSLKRNIAYEMHELIQVDPSDRSSVVELKEPGIKKVRFKVWLSNKQGGRIMPNASIVRDRLTAASGLANTVHQVRVESHPTDLKELALLPVAEEGSETPHAAEPSERIQHLRQLAETPAPLIAALEDAQRPPTAATAVLSGSISRSSSIPPSPQDLRKQTEISVVG
jgi:hypothetical protein